LIGALAVASLILYLTDASASGPQTYRGLTAQQWYERANDRVVERNAARAKTRAVAAHLKRLARSNPIGTHWLERAFLCIHSGEGAWASATGNGYYGGMQMDSGFQRTYGPEFYRAWGTANNWPASVQLAVSMRAYLSGRGFGPWPTTSRNCGLR
jgi:hypothetical protein